MFDQIFFGYCALMIISSGILAISLRNPVHCVLMVLVLFFHMAGLYLTLQAEFAEEIGAVRFGRARTDEKFFGDAGIVFSFGRELQHHAFARREGFQRIRVVGGLCDERVDRPLR